MRLAFSLYVTKHGNVRINKTGSSELRASEIRIDCKLDIPDLFFTRPVPVAKIVVPESALADPSIECIVEVTAKAVADALHLDVQAVTDGLMGAVARTEGQPS